MRTVLSMFAVLAIFHGAAVQAQAFTQARVQIDQEDAQGNVSAPLSSASHPTSVQTGIEGEGFAKAATAYGANHAFAQAVGQPAGRWHIAASTWGDGFTVTGMPSGLINVSVDISGTLSGSFIAGTPPVGVDWLYMLLVSSTPLLGDTMWNWLSEDAAYADDGSILAPAGATALVNELGSVGGSMGLKQASFAFTEGEKFYLTSFLNVDAVGEGLADFYHSAHFGITAPDGAALFTDSGTLFAAAVPEPETYALLLAGLSLLGFAARRRRKAGGLLPT